MRTAASDLPAAARNWISPFSVSPSGGKPGAPPPPLRCGSGKAPALSKVACGDLGPERKNYAYGGLGAPLPPPLRGHVKRSELYAVNRTDRLLKKADRLTC